MNISFSSSVSCWQPDHQGQIRGWGSSVGVVLQDYEDERGTGPLHIAKFMCMGCFQRLVNEGRLRLSINDGSAEGDTNMTIPIEVEW